MDWHRPRLDALIEAGVDLLAFETIPSIKEGLALCKLLKEYPNHLAWLSFSCKVKAVFNKLVTKFHLKFYKSRMKVNYVLEIHLNKLMNFFVIIHK
jgi:hypothetical protein